MFHGFRDSLKGAESQDQTSFWGKVNILLPSHLAPSCVNCILFAGMTYVCEHYDHARLDTPWIVQTWSPADKLFWRAMALLHLQLWRAGCLGLEDTEAALCSSLPMRVFAAALSGCPIMRSHPPTHSSADWDRCRHFLTQPTMSNKTFCLCMRAPLRMWFSICTVFQGTFPRMLEFTWKLISCFLITSERMYLYLDQFCYRLSLV